MITIRQTIVEVVRDRFAHGNLGGMTFEKIVEEVWKEMVAKDLKRAIDEGKVQHINNRYYPGA